MLRSMVFSRTFPASVLATQIRPLFSWFRVQKLNSSRLFTDAEKDFPERLRKDGWYLTTAAALIASGQQARIGDLYQHLLRQPDYQSVESRQRLVRRLREAMVKCIILNGIPIVMEGFQSLAKVEQPEDQDHSFTRAGWKADETNYRRGMRALETIYRDDSEKITASFGAHKDIPWISVAISYGLFLADYTVLNMQEAELVIFPAIACQSLEGPTRWHLRGCLRIGMTKHEVDSVHKVTEMVARFGGLHPLNLVRVWDIEDGN